MCVHALKLFASFVRKKGKHCDSGGEQGKNSERGKLFLYCDDFFHSVFLHVFLSFKDHSQNTV